MKKRINDMSVDELLDYYELDKELVPPVPELKMKIVVAPEIQPEKVEKLVLPARTPPNKETHILTTETIGGSLIVLSVLIQIAIEFYTEELKNLFVSQNSEIVTLSVFAVLINLVAVSLFFHASHVRKSFSGWWYAFTCLALNALISLSVYYKYVNSNGLTQ